MQASYESVFQVDLDQAPAKRKLKHEILPQVTLGDL